MDTEQNVIEVFELIAHRQIRLKTGPWNYDSVDLADAQLLLEPRLHILGLEVEELYKQHGIDRSVLVSLRAAEAITGFIIGVLCGLDLAGRPDIVGRFAHLYARETKRTIDSLFTNSNVH